MHPRANPAAPRALVRLHRRKLRERAGAAGERTLLVQPRELYRGLGAPHRFAYHRCAQSGSVPAVLSGVPDAFQRDPCDAWNIAHGEIQRVRLLHAGSRATTMASPAHTRSKESSSTSMG